MKFNLSLFELCNFGTHFGKGKLAGILDIINEICYNSDTYKSQVIRMKMEKKDPLYRSFGYAFREIFTCVRPKERNMKIHCVAAVLVVIAGVILKISAIEWCDLYGAVRTGHGAGTCEYGSGSGGGYGDRRISPVGESCERYRGRSSATLLQLWQRSQGALYLCRR